MTKNELRLILEAENVRHYRVNGFSFSHSGCYAVLKGRIPLSLARKINEGIDNTKLKICVHGVSYYTGPDEWATNADLADILSELMGKHNLSSLEDDYQKAKISYIQKAESENRLDDIYILYYHIHTEEGIRHVIKCIRESGYVNQCLFD